MRRVPDPVRAQISALPLRGVIAGLILALVLLAACPGALVAVALAEDRITAHLEAFGLSILRAFDCTVLAFGCLWVGVGGPRVGGSLTRQISASGGGALLMALAAMAAQDRLCAGVHLLGIVVVAPCALFAALRLAIRWRERGLALGIALVAATWMLIAAACTLIAWL